MRKKYDNIQLMRGIAVLTVVFMHVQMFKNGAFGVELFFCISGFIMMHVTSKDSNKFLIKRAIRIVPLYWLTIFATTALLIVVPQFFKTVTYSNILLIKSLAFIPFFYTGASGSTINSLVQVGWTLVMEVFFYLVFYFACLINRKYRHFISGAVLIVMTIVGYIFKESNVTFIKFYCQPIILEFALGMFSYNILVKKGKADPDYTMALPARIISLVTATAIWIFLFVEKYIPQIKNIDRFYKYGIPAFIFFVLIFKSTENIKIPKIFVFIGNISYSIYLTHSFVVQGFSRLIYNIDKISLPGFILVFVVVIPLVIGVGYVSWFIVENKFTEFLKQKFLKATPHN